MFNYDDLYGVNLKEYCIAHNTNPEKLIQKIDIDIRLLKNRLNYLLEQESQKPFREQNNSDLYLITKVYQLIQKKEKHKDRLREWANRQD